MSEPFVGEIRMFGGNFAPRGWMLCNGQTLAISSYTALFSLIGTTYGGNGVQTFQLPDLQGRLPVGQGQGPGLANYVIGESSGSEQVTLLVSNLPPHNHLLSASTTAANTATIGNTVLPGKIASGHFYVANTGSPAPTVGHLNPMSASMAGSGLPHSNLMPSLCVSFIISTIGIFPSRN
jgi:microcystin-dependent protein